MERGNTIPEKTINNYPNVVLSHQEANPYYIYVSLSLSLYIYIYTYICMYVCMYVCMYACMSQPCTPGRDYTCRAASRTEVLPRRLHTWDVCKQMAIERESVRYARACAQAHLDLQVHECAFDADRNLRVHVQLYT